MQPLQLDRQVPVAQVETVIAKIVASLEQGGVVLLPTDTVYGLAVSPHYPDAVKRLYYLKNRPQSQHLPIMVATSQALDNLGLKLSPAAQKLLDSPLIPGSITLALGFKSEQRLAWLQGRDEVAIRIPNEAYLLAVLNQTGPLLVTSANLHGRDTPEIVPDILSDLQGVPDLAVDGGNLKTIPSTLVNCHCEPPQIERIGAIAAETVREYLA